MLNKIEKKEVKRKQNVFSEKARKVFNKLERASTKAPLPQHFDARIRTRVDTDASGNIISDYIYK